MISAVFSSERLDYRPVSVAEIPFYEKALTDERVMRFMNIRFTTNQPGKEQWEWYQSQLASGSALYFSMYKQSTREFCGVISLYYYNAPNQKAELGYWLLPAHWGQGYATEACQAMLQYAASVWPLHRVEAFIETDHAASRQILKKCGFRLEGCLREVELKAGKWIDLELWSLLFVD